MRAKVDKENALRVVAEMNDFEGDVDKWKTAFYEMWRWQMTWSFAYEIAVREGRKSGVFIDMLIRPAYRTSVLGTMEDLGYRNIRVYEDPVGVVYDLDDYSIDTFVGE